MVFAPCLLLLAAPLSELVTKGFDHFYNLEYEEAIEEFQAAVGASPQDPDCHNHLAQAILFQAMYRAGALESELVSGTNPFLRRPKMNPTPEQQRRFDQAIERAIGLARGRISADSKDARAWYALGVAYGLRANYNFLVRKAWFDSLRDATNARKAHNKVTEIEPGNWDARLVQGTHEYVVANLPFHVRMLGFVAGFRGDREGGIRTLQRVAEEGVKNRVDAEVLLAAIYRRERRPAAAVPLLHDLIRRFPRNYLFRLEMVQMFSDLGKKEDALEVLARIEHLKRRNAPGYRAMPMEKVYYSRGVLLFWYNDLEKAEEDLRKVVSNTAELDLNTGLMAYLRLGQTLDLLEKRQEALKAYRAAVETAPQAEAAREAKRYISSPYRRKQG